MVDAIKTVVDTIEELHDFEAIIDNYIATRQRLQEEIKTAIETAAEVDKVLLNDINDYGCICKEEGMYLGLYYGIKLKDSIDTL